MDDTFAFNMGHEVPNEDPEPKYVEDCRNRDDWPKWKEAIEAELNFT